MFCELALLILINRIRSSSTQLDGFGSVKVLLRYFSNSSRYN